MTTPDGRLHALDALRAAMMLLGIVLHGAISYVVTPLGLGWPYKDTSTNGVLDLLTFLIHLFRMPTFFVMAGFFAALVYGRRGPAAFLRHRARRLLLPLALAWPLVVPITGVGFLFAVRQGGLERAGFPASATAADVARAGGISLGHLWFLEYLFLYCLAAVVLVALSGRLPASWREKSVGACGRHITTMRGSLLLGVLTGLTLLPMNTPVLDTSATIVPALRVVVAYAVFFAAGWLLFLARDGIGRLGRVAWRHLGVAGLAVTVQVAVMVTGPFPAPWVNWVAACLAGGIATWQLVIAATGLAVRYLPAERPVIRYLADASYWMYLTHLPIVVWTVGLLGPVPLGALVKCAIVVAVATLATLVTYHYWVRSTAIGSLLNGRRVPPARRSHSFS